MDYQNGKPKKEDKLSTSISGGRDGLQGTILWKNPLHESHWNKWKMYKIVIYA